MYRDGLRLSITLLSVLPAVGPLREHATPGGAAGDKSAGGRAAGNGAAGGYAAGTAGTGEDTGPPWGASEPPQAAAESARAASAGPSRAAAGAAMAWAPAVGLLLGVIAAAVLYVCDHLLHTGSLVAAVLAVGSLAVLSRALHLDGLADLADGLGSQKLAPEALDIMRRSDIGPFGVITLVFTLLIQIAGLAQADASGRGPAAIIVAAVTGRLAITWACRRGVRAARRDGLGALVAGTVSPVVPAVLTAVVLAVTVGGIVAAHAIADVPVEWILPVAVAAGLVAAAALAAHAARRLGGITGDVLGAVVETATAACLAVTAIS